MEKELCVKLIIYKDYTEMHGQQNIKSLKLGSLKMRKSMEDCMYIYNYLVILPKNKFTFKKF